MNLCISNIAWKKEENNEALKILKKHEINAIDVAPTLLFDSIDNLTKKNLIAKHKEYEKLGFKIIAAQSLLYGIPPYSIFDGDNERGYIIQHLEKVFSIAKELKIKNLVFGSPKNRYIKNNNEDNEIIAKNFFQKISNIANDYNLIICLEANPKEYDCNFITTTFEAIDFIKTVNKKNFLLNFDTSTVLLNNDKFDKVLEYSYKYIKHIHISSPHIKEIKNMDHENISNLLKLYNYSDYISLEMKPNLTNNNLKNLEENVKILKKYY